MPVLARYPHGGEVKVTAPHPTDTPGYAPPTPQKFERLQECERIQCGQLYIHDVITLNGLDESHAFIDDKSK